MRLRKLSRRDRGVGSEVVSLGDLRVLSVKSFRDLEGTAHRFAPGSIPG